jgi:hypothetical protein
LLDPEIGRGASRNLERIGSGLRGTHPFFIARPGDRTWGESKLGAYWVRSQGHTTSCLHDPEIGHGMPTGGVETDRRLSITGRLDKGIAPSAVRLK